MPTAQIMSVDPATKETTHYTVGLPERPANDQDPFGVATFDTRCVVHGMRLSNPSLTFQTTAIILGPAQPDAINGVAYTDVLKQIAEEQATPPKPTRKPRKPRKK